MKLHISATRAFLIGLAMLIVVGVLSFNVVYFSTYYGMAQIDYVNALLLVPFILLIFSFGIFIEQSKQNEKVRRIDRYPLTAKEKEVALLMLQKKKNQEIADALFVERSTIKTHINAIYRKIGVTNRRELFDKLNS